VVLVITDISEEPRASIIRMERISEHNGITSQETAFFIVTAMETSNLGSGTISACHWNG
jgi:hypothetical protein